MGNKRHMTMDDRIKIQEGLDSGASCRSIAKTLGRTVSAITREIKLYSKSINAKSYCGECVNYYGCAASKVCGSRTCRKRKCIGCYLVNKHCTYFEPVPPCAKDEPPYVCNACPNRRKCVRQRFVYEAPHANAHAMRTLKESRSGFAVTDDELAYIEENVVPLLLQGQSPYAAIQTLGKDNVPVSEATLRRMIDGNKLTVRNIDLRSKVKRKPKRQRPNAGREDEWKRQKVGHTYDDYLKYQEEHALPVVEMDCVIGKREDSCALLTLHFPQFHLQLYFMLDKHDSNHVKDMLDRIEMALGTELFKQVFPVILTDNGTEFAEREELEASIKGGLRSIIFYCRPYCSSDKPHCERNHEFVRYVIPKGYSLESFTQADMTKLTNHVNSYPRKALFGRTPYQVAKTILPEDFFIALGLEEIPKTKVCLKPELVGIKRETLLELVVENNDPIASIK